MIFHENCLLADNSYKISYLIFFRKLGKMWQNLSSAAVVIGVLRVKLPAKNAFETDICLSHHLQEQSDLGLHCFTMRLLKHFSRWQKQTTFVVISDLSFDAI